MAVAALLLAFAPYAAQAEKRVDDEDQDHSNQDLGQPDTRVITSPAGAPGNWGGPKGDPGFEGPGASLEPLSIGRVRFLGADEVAGRWDPKGVLLPILTPPDEWPFPETPPGVGERFVDWNLPSGAWDGWPDVDGIGYPGFGPPAPIPEPGTLSLLVLGGALVAAGRRRGA